ncbi:MAG: phosphotransferase [Desulfobacterales bacterium]|nr:MAG: phosphotransferase [Desulfobacterales bacterium]
MKAMILAAGYGTRLRPFTDHTPKALFSIAGRPLLDVTIERLQKAGCRAVIINTHHLHHQIETYIASRQYGIEVTTRHEPQILGTGGAIKNVADFWDDAPFMVINADIIAEVDLAEIYRAHCRHQPAATLVLCDNPAFNSVAVEQNQRITGFQSPTRDRDQASGGLLTFTGIQVLEPEVLDFIPPNTPYSSIDAFRQMLADGRKLRAFMVSNDCWQDIGSPERYRQAAINKAVPQAFEQAFAAPCRRQVDSVKLKGDGSQRQWYRLKSDRGSLIMVDHGIRETRMTSEVDAFVDLGRHLYRQGVPVPRIHFYDTFSGLVFLEDLGDIHLQQMVQSTTDTSQLIRLYESVIVQIIQLSRRGAANFDRRWTYQTTDYDRELILERECRYFQEAFLAAYVGFDIRFEDLAAEFTSLADKTLQHPHCGFMHRDMQSRNIMVKDGRIYFIDFQGGRIGPIQYDLASLLIDPYVDLPRSIQSRLVDYSLEMLSALVSVDPDQFRDCYHYCTLTRNLQILGAFAHLSRVKGKKQFAEYIPAAVRTLRSNLKAKGHNEFPRLSEVVKDACRQLRIV